jgi:imidazolonepropionase-like amidohydrolase
MIKPLVRAFGCAIYLFFMTTSALFAATTTMETAVVNGIADDRSGAIAFTGAVLVVAPGDERDDAMLLIRDGKIEAVTTGSDIPSGYRKIDLKGRYIYPGLIDFYSHYGMPKQKPLGSSRFRGPEVLDSTSYTANNASESIKSHIDAADLFTNDDEQAAKYRKRGFSTVVSFNPDGIARGTSVAVLTDGGLPNLSVVREHATTHYSFEKGSARQFFPVSRMGVVALLRQTYMDAEWFTAQNPRPFTDLSLEAWHENRTLPKVMSAFDWKTTLLADKVGDEFGDQYIIKGGGDEYQRLDAVKATNATMIISVAFPEAPDVSDPFTVGRVSLQQLKHWELAPYNLARLESAGIPFVITSADAGKKFWKHLRLAVKSGLSQEAALAALTTTPAKLMGEEARLGSLAPGKFANMIITDKPLFDEEARLLQTWVKGQRFDIVDSTRLEPGEYELNIQDQTWPIKIEFAKAKYSGKVLPVKGPEEAVESAEAKLELSVENNYLNLKLREGGQVTRLAGWPDGSNWQGEAVHPDGSLGQFTLKQVASGSADEEEADEVVEPGSVIYPFVAHGAKLPPNEAHLLIRGATVWTNEVDGILIDTDVLIRNGKIQKVGKNIAVGKARVVDGAGLHVTAGIIDEHSHIGLDAINEFSTNSSMVRMADVIDPEDIGIYRNLSGGVTASQLLHGSANPIGGQSALVKMRWGETPTGMLIKNADPFIKFALGENVKRSTNAQSIRYPQSRMGVEQVFVNAFNEARRYEAERLAYEALSGRAKRGSVKPRRDLRMDTMVEVLNGKRFVTSHSYVQSEINMLMHVAEQFDFRINTFTHILEGYKVADKMAAHGVGGSTFSDWWAYKWEVRYAIPYNAALMNLAGVTTAINSDDAEMSRRLNHEAAKSIRYGGMGEEEALKMVTLNPAKLLHLDDRMGSIKAGKDADIVLWSDHPLSVYSKSLMTLVDGKVYFDRAEDLALRVEIAAERNRLIQKILNRGKASKEKGSAEGSGAPPNPEKLDYHHDLLDEQRAALEMSYE